MKIKAALAVAALMALPLAARAQVLTFEGIGDEVSIGNWYNGGGGPNYGISFSSNALSLIEVDAGGSGNFEEAPSGVAGMFFLEGVASTMNVAAGFTTGFSFYYSTPFYTGSINVWSGLNATGSLLATLVLPETPANGDPGCNGFNYCPFVPIGVTFAGTAMSVDFAGTANYIVFDNITLGSNVPGGAVPEPATMSLMAMGLVGMAGAARRRRRK